MDLGSLYGNKVRVRVLGVLEKENKFLLIKHKGLNESNEFWHVPGGGLNKGETLEQALKRELLEEANIHVEIENFLGFAESINLPYHAIEVYFKINTTEIPSLGYDPELNILLELAFMSLKEIEDLPAANKASTLIKILNDRTHI